jgi:hypothetical protein
VCQQPGENYATGGGVDYRPFTPDAIARRRLPDFAPSRHRHAFCKMKPRSCRHIRRRGLVAPAHFPDNFYAINPVVARESALCRGPWRDSSTKGGMKNKKQLDYLERPALRDAINVVRCSDGCFGEWWPVTFFHSTARSTQAVNSGLSGFVVFAALFLQLSACAAGMVNLAWDPDTNASTAGYNVYYGSVSGVYTNEVSVGRATNVTISGLVQGITYFFAATTYKESTLSGEISYFLPLQAVLSLQILRFNGVPVSISIVANGTVPGYWAVQSSPDLKTWTTIAQGTNQAVNLLVPFGGLPMQFFRLMGQ